MTRTQIQFPDPLYKRLKMIAEQQDWSLAEVMRKAAEHFVERFPEPWDRAHRGVSRLWREAAIFSWTLLNCARRSTPSTSAPLHDRLCRHESVPVRGQSGFPAPRSRAAILYHRGLRSAAIPPLRAGPRRDLHAVAQPGSPKEAAQRQRSHRVLPDPALQPRMGVRRL